jgi:hypothetical protein
MKRKAPSDLQQLFPKLRCTDGDLTLIGKSSNKAGNGVMFQVQWQKSPEEVIIISGRDSDKNKRVCVMGLPGDTNATIDRFHIVPKYQRSGFGTRIMGMLKILYRNKGTSRLLVTNPRGDAVGWYTGKQHFEKDNMGNLVFELQPKNVRSTAQMPPRCVLTIAENTRTAKKNCIWRSKRRFELRSRLCDKSRQ